MTTLAAPVKYRVTSIDLLRGIVMVIMALDHVRDFFHVSASVSDPTNMETTTPTLFFTRWITHFCAPTFVFLAGTSAYLSGTKKTTTELGSFLRKRGLWLILIEIALMSLIFTFNPLYNVIILQVIWSIGVSMILLSFLIRLPISVILVTGLLIISLHNLLDYPEAARNGDVGFVWSLFHRQGFFPYTSDHFLFIFYPFMPWFGIMCCGYCFGSLYKKDFPAEKRKKILLQLGLGIILLFVVVRFINIYGDRAPWGHQRNIVYTFLSFLNTTKYPPSFLYTCMTLGPGILFLAFIEQAQNKIAQFFIVFGRVPFFYYVLHFFVVHLLTVIVFFATGYTMKDLIPKNTPFLFRPDNFGFSLWVVYLIWASIIIGLYPLCKWYNKYKSTHQQWWLSYV
ncbi:MAG TPA: heparan-alpha-glucosaminide N-acetyltransferase domain-containing protein [Puia sp.]|nr:heparan-alpha-glucosaminide N-acetyltransferase domain-containing protein [Puia sp.]